MPSTYITKAGQTVDLVCRDFYGRTRSTTEIVLDANPGIGALGPVLPIGTALVLPDIDTRPAARELVKIWE
ncbi:phage tail protein [Shinella sumterensis]|uniref:tail protein X n=1 Tax=Shinella sumterensis TaxID=1967501 RepID=UPI00106F062F|nr:tail protein X [Shinella sumterensis]MCD1264086.1 phage tail protein [Shinella sumterensis]TFE99383.1 phage tail protein [Shinella sumterensis]